MTKRNSLENLKYIIFLKRMQRYISELTYNSFLRCLRVSHILFQTVIFIAGLVKKPALILMLEELVPELENWGGRNHN